MKAIGVACLAISGMMIHGGADRTAYADSVFSPGFYVNAKVGVNRTSSTEFITTGSTRTEVKFKRGPVGSIAVGYRLDRMNVRVEGEMSYRRAKTDRYIQSNVEVAGNNTHLTSVSAMANGYLDFDVGFEEVRPYIGIGFGTAMVFLDEFSVGTSVQGGGDDLVIAFQGMAGAEWEVQDGLAVTAEYRFYRTQQVDVFQTTDTIENQNHGFLLGMRYMF